MTDMDDALTDPLQPLPFPCGFTPPSAAAAPAPTAGSRITIDGALLKAWPKPKSWGESRAAGLRRRRAERRKRAAVKNRPTIR
jgi:hypothetical protein